MFLPHIHRGGGMGNKALITYGWEDSTDWNHNSPVLFSNFENRGRLRGRKNVIYGENTEKMSVFSAVSPGFFPAYAPSHYCHAPQSKRVLVFLYLPKKLPY